MQTLEQVDRIVLTSVVDNYVDPLLSDVGPAKRRPRQEKSYERCLCGEHGLAELVESTRDGKSFSLLFDFGGTPLVYVHNLQILVEDYGIDLSQIDTLVLSHGHWDHYGGLCGFLDTKRQDLAAQTHLYAGEDAFLHRWRVSLNTPRSDMGALDEAFVASMDIDIVRVKEPCVLRGQVLVSGEIPRRTSYEAVSPAMRVESENGEVADTLPGEQALIYHLRGKGLVVLTACGHAGVVNTTLHAREITGIDDIYAIIGGFHLNGAPDQRIRQTVADLAELDPEMIVPMHCTGHAMIDALQRQFAERVVLNSAGTRYLLDSNQ